MGRGRSAGFANGSAVKLGKRKASTPLGQCSVFESLLRTRAKLWEEPVSHTCPAETSATRLKVLPRTSKAVKTASKACVCRCRPPGVDLHVQRHVGSLDVPYMGSLPTIQAEGLAKKPHFQAFWQRLAAWAHLGGKLEVGAVVRICSTTRPSREEGDWRRRQGWKRDQEIWEARTARLFSL